MNNLMHYPKQMLNCSRKGWIILISFMVIVLLWSMRQLFVVNNISGNPKPTLSDEGFTLLLLDKESHRKKEIPKTKYNLAIGIFSVERPNAPDYVYAEVMSILDSLFVKQDYINIDKIHVFDGSFNGSQVRYFKYSRNVEVHPMDPVAYEMVRHHPVHRKASLNYLLALKYLLNHYQTALPNPDAEYSNTLMNEKKSPIDAYLILEDDVIFDPNAGYLIWKTLHYVKPLELFLIDGYVQNGKPLPEEEISAADKMPVISYNATAKCCSQSFLLSPKVAELSIPLIEASLNGSVIYHPLDIYLTAALLKIPTFQLFLAKECWVQHVGLPFLGLGTFHRGCSRMEFD